MGHSREVPVDAPDGEALLGLPVLTARLSKGAEADAQGFEVGTAAGHGSSSAHGQRQLMVGCGDFTMAGDLGSAVVDPPICHGRP